MAYMEQRKENPNKPMVNLVFLLEYGTKLPNVLEALQKAKQSYATGTAIEVREFNSTAGYLIYVPFTAQEYVDNFFKAQGEGK